MPRLLTRRERYRRLGVAGFISEWWPTSNRNGGRLHLGTGGRLRSESALKSRGYRWNAGDDGRPKAWWTEVDEEVLDVELRFLKREVYLREVDLRREHITAYERYRAP